MAEAIAGRQRQGRKLLVCGNGGNAGGAQHIAGEFISRLMFDREPLAAIALTTDTSVITASGNDLVFTGMTDCWPNMDSFRWLAHEVLPPIAPAKQAA